MVGFIWLQISLSVVRSDTLLIKVHQDNQGHLGIFPVWEDKAGGELTRYWVK